MPLETIAKVLLSCVNLEDRKTLSVVNSTFRLSFCTQQMMRSFTLLVHSSEQLGQLKTHTGLLQHTVHLLVLLTHKSVTYECTCTCPGTCAGHDATSLLELFVVDAIVLATSVARLASISVASCNATTSLALCSKSPSQSQLDQCKARLDCIRADDLRKLTYVNVQPVNKVLSHAWRTLLDRAAAIDTLEFRNRAPSWLRGYTNRPACLALGPEELDFIGAKCRSLRKLLGVRVNEETVCKLACLRRSQIELQDVFLVYSNVPMHSFRLFLLSQLKLVNVHIENIGVHWQALDGLYETARAVLGKLEKFDVFCKPPADTSAAVKIKPEDLNGMYLSDMPRLRKVQLDGWDYYLFNDSDHLYRFERLHVRSFSARYWKSAIPSCALACLTSLRLSKTPVGESLLGVVDGCRLSSLKCYNCSIQSGVFERVSRMRALSKLVLVDCDVPGNAPISFEMPQLRELVFQGAFDSAYMQYVGVMLRNVANLVRLTLLDSSTLRDTADGEFNWLDLSGLRNLRWLVTNVYVRAMCVCFDVSRFPLLERLSIVPRGGGRDTQSHVSLVGYVNEPVCISSSEMQLVSYLFVREPSRT